MNTLTKPQFSKQLREGGAISVKQQLGGLGRGTVKQVIQEPLEILKDAGSQVSGIETTALSQAQSVSQPGVITPSLDERRRVATLAAHSNELEELIKQKRDQRQQVARHQEAVENQEKVQVEQKKREANESIFQKGLKMVTGRLKRRTETRQPKAA